MWHRVAQIGPRGPIENGRRVVRHRASVAGSRRRRANREKVRETKIGAMKIQVEVKVDRLIRLPPGVPAGPAEVVVPTPATAVRRPVGIVAGLGFSVTNPLPGFDGKG